MPTLHLLHGLPGAGKTTFARELARQRNAVRFSPDEWMIALHGTNPPEPLFRDQLRRIFGLIWDHAQRVLATGTDVVVDGGFWKRAERDDARRRAREWGVECRLYVLDCPLAEARRRVAGRTAAMPDGALVITAETFDVLASWVETVGDDEPHLRVRGAAEDGGVDFSRPW